MIKTTKTMLSKAWAIVSAFKPEEALHNERLNKTIGLAQSKQSGRLQTSRTANLRSITNFKPGMFSVIAVEPTFKEISHERFISDLEADKETGFGNEGGAK